MNVDNRINYVTNFKAVDPKIMKNFSSFERDFRTSLAENIKTLEQSKYVDLCCDDANNIFLKLKKEILTAYGKIKAGSLIQSAPASYEVNNSNILFKDLKINGEKSSICLEMATAVNAKYAENEYDRLGGLPSLGAIIDTSQQISGPLLQVEKIMSNFTNG